MRTCLLNPILRSLAIASLWFVTGIAQAQIPQTINYQGYLTNSASQPVNAAVNITFRLYTAASGGSPVWAETQAGVGVTNGIYNAVLGSVAPLALPFNVPYYLSLQVNSDAEMAGRQPLSAVPYAMRAMSADGFAASATIPAAQISGTLASSQFAATQLLPTTACTANQFSQWNGTAWVCATGTGTSTTSDVTGNLTMVNSTATVGNILKGGARFIHNSGSGNTFVGENAGTLTLSGMNNTATGYRALGSDTVGQSNTAIGAAALLNNTTGFRNTASGAGTLTANVDGSGNTASGDQALLGNTGGGDNTAIGRGALKFSNGNNNIGIGADAGSAIESGNNNIAIGNAAQSTDSGVVRIGTDGTHGKVFIAGVRGVSSGVADALPVVIDSNGQLGTSADGSNPITNLFLPITTPTAGIIFQNGLSFIHSFGGSNSFVGALAGNFTMTGGSNIGVGYQALLRNSSGNTNTAIGYRTLWSNTTGYGNTANGFQALLGNTTGAYNSASGWQALVNNTTGVINTAFGYAAMYSNTSGQFNVALGAESMEANTTGNNNAAIGYDALLRNTVGYGNTAVGRTALPNNTSGNLNIALGVDAGVNLTTGDNNIDIANPGVAAEGNTIRIGDSNQTRTFIAGIHGVTPGVGNGLPVVIDSNGQLGTGAVVGGGVSSVATGAGLTGGPITATGTINLASTQLLPITPCALDQFPKWNGTAWVCAAGGVGPQGPAGPIGPQGVPGSVTSITAGSGLSGGTITGAGTIAIDPASAVLADNFFKQGGNNFAGTAVLGSSNGAVEINVNNARALRIEPTTDGPNIALGHAANVAGGTGVSAATVGGGGIAQFPNFASATYATVGGGVNNKALAEAGTVAGGNNNTVGEALGTVGGGLQNNVTGILATIGGGSQNKASASGATIGGGDQNEVSDFYSTVGGGSGNLASGYIATVSGGGANVASGLYATVGGGNSNVASGISTLGAATVAGGYQNTANGSRATVGGGFNNKAIGSYATVPGGSDSQANGNYSFAAGRRAIATSAGCFVWGDSTDADINCTFANAFSVRASGGIYLRTNAAISTGCDIPAGGGAWACTSSRESKQDFTAMNPADVLQRVVDLPVTQWRYRTEESGARHVGPMAEDFHAAFGLGDSTKTINVMDASGVALTAIQGLHALLQSKDREIDALKRDLDAIKKKLGLD